MRTRGLFPGGVLLAVSAACGRTRAPRRRRAGEQTPAAAGFRAVATEIGGVDHTGPYNAVADWPKPLSQLPGHDKWTTGATETLYAESPDRVLLCSSVSCQP